MKTDDVTHSRTRERHLERPAAQASRTTRTQVGDAGVRAAAEAQLPLQQVVHGAAEASRSAGSQEATRPHAAPMRDDRQSRAELESQVRDLDVRVHVQGYATVSFEVSSEDPPVIVLRDAESGAELRRIPPETVAKLIDAFRDLKGLLINYRS